MRALITGVAAFIGSALAERLVFGDGEQTAISPSCPTP